MLVCCIWSEVNGEKRQREASLLMQRNKNNSKESSQSPESNQTGRENGKQDCVCVKRSYQQERMNEWWEEG